MAYKIYTKRGAPNLKEREMVKAIQKAIDERKSKDPEYVFDRVCHTHEELRNLFNEMCTEEVPFEEIKQDNSIDDKIKDLNKGDEELELIDSGDFIDPFNRSNPIIRDYVTDDSLSKNTFDSTEHIGNNYSEPLSFDEAFKLPEDSSVVKHKKVKKEPSEPLNPDFGNMTAAKQKKNTKLFAKYIVEAVCTLAEKGFVYFSTNETNEAKLTEYEITGELDLNILLTLENGQQATVKKWFLQQNITAQELAVIDQESRDELSDVLGEVLLEKGVTPTPMQSLLMVAGKIFLIDKGLKLLEIKMQINSVLNQLRAMKAQEKNTQEFKTETEEDTKDNYEPSITQEENEQQ